MARARARIVICGAGFAGVAAAFHLAARQGIDDILLVDEREPLTLTSNKGTEAYRNWWPGPGDTMLRFMNRSIDLLEQLAHESDNVFRLNRRGYLFTTAREAGLDQLREDAHAICTLGAGALRIHGGAGAYQPAAAAGFMGQPDGADLLADPTLLRRHYPYISETAVGALHVRRAGWFDSATLGRYLLDQVLAAGVTLRHDRVMGVRRRGGRVQAVTLAAGGPVETGIFVAAPGPLLPQVGQMLDLDLPVANERHGKVIVPDDRRLLPGNAPLTIWNDPVSLEWSDDERGRWASEAENRRLLDNFPAGVHFRTRATADGQEILIIYTYDLRSGPAVFPIPFAPHYGEVLLRAAARLAPALRAYFGRGWTGQIDGGYYCKTPENRPLIGPLPIEGAFVVSALSGFGLMGSQAAGELLAAHITGAPLPDYAPAFLPSRYDDPAYQALMDSLDPASGQL